MTHRNVHYEAAFEDYLRVKGWPYVAVDEAKKAVFAGALVKSFDFLVYSASGANLLVDVKGRKFPGAASKAKPGPSRAWENWVTREDVEGLRKWARIFGDDFTPVFVFAYWLQGTPRKTPFEDVHLFRRRHYAFMAASLSDYAAAAKDRSAKWGTITVPKARFVRMAKDIAAFL